MTDPYGGNWGRIVRPGGSGMPRPMGSGLAGRMVRPMGNARGCNQWVTHRYYSATGSEIWRADHGSIVRAIAVDSSGNVYTAGGLSSNPAHYKLQKWTSSGSRVWGVLVDSDQGSDVAVDPDGNIWLAVGTALEKYSPSGSLLATFTAIPWPEWTTGTDLYCADIGRVAVSSSGLVVFGSSGFSITSPPALFVDHPFMPGNAMNLDGSNQGVIGGIIPLAGAYDYGPDSTVSIHYYGYHFDSEGRIYAGHSFSSNVEHEDDVGHTCAFAYDPVSYPDENHEDVLRHAIIGQAGMFVEADDYPHYRTGGTLAVHQPTDSLLMAYGVNGEGEIKDVATIIPGIGVDQTLEIQTTLVDEPNACKNGVLAVNDNHRYVYGINAVGATIRVRNYPNTFLWQADHKTDVNDAIIKADNTVLIGGERVYDDCVPVGLAAVAGCTNTGIVTVYEIDGSVRWSKTLLTSTSVNHDICFDASGGIWARNGDGSQLVHTDPTGIILTDVDIGSVSGQPSAPAIAFSAGGLAYCNQPDAISDSPYQVAVAASGPLLTPGGVFHLTEQHIGITTAGKVAAWDSDRYGIWSADGTLEYYGDWGNVVLGFSNLEAAAVSPTGDYLYWLAYSTTHSKVYIGTVNLNTGVVSGGTDTLLTNVTAAWCTPSGTPYYGATSLSILPSSSFPSNIYKISGGTNRIVVAAGSKLELWTFALGNYSRNWTKSVSSVSCDYFRG